MPARTTARDDRAYLALVRRHPLRPIRSEADLDRAIAMIDELLGRDDLDAGEADYLDVLSDLVERYETDTYPEPPAADASVLRYLMDARGLNQVRLAAEAGIPVSTVSDVLAGKRRLSKSNIGALSRRFHVSPAAFSFDPPSKAKATTRRK
ncbi:MAG TPA: helix-turn-helix domain-containing protein [Isosphaeraceae bacterium]|jgi:HTH-type transcriptional regulator/antitoxin HigA|nr:helix-turn-helix domain-containing protein [Isosphaeraceae bacterium]